MYGKERILKFHLHPKGYYTVILYKNKKRRSFQVQQVIAMAFLDHIPCGMELVVDHINSTPLDNRPENLRIITNRENLSKERTQKSGLPTGVHFCKQKNVIKARININGKAKHLGTFSTPEEASQAYQNALKNLV
jgi:hypothetical protein